MTESNPLKWHGGKSYLADKIIAEFPPHIHYVEPFFGGGAVLFRKSCEGVSEVVNDLNGRLTNFWATLKDDLAFGVFQSMCDRTPFSSEEWMEALNRGSAPILKPEDPYSAHAFFVQYRQSRQGIGKDFATLSRNRTRRGMNEQVSSWLTAIEGLPEAHERLKRVVILNDDACKVIKQQDGPNTLFYCDPPYLHETRVTTGDYECEMSVEQHSELADCSQNVKGKVVLSGYPSELYDAWFSPANGWRRVDIEIDNKASSKATKDKKIECLWMNY